MRKGPAAEKDRSGKENRVRKGTETMKEWTMTLNLISLDLVPAHFGPAYLEGRFPFHGIGLWTESADTRGGPGAPEERAG